MQAPATIFSQIVSGLYRSEFARCVQQFPMQRSPRGLSAYDQFLALVFGQLTYRESLRDIVCCLQAGGREIYHSGFRGHLTRTNLAYANQHRDWRVFQAAAQILMRRAGRLYCDDSDRDHARVAFALDSTMISLSLDWFPWGYYARTRKAAMKLHLLLALQGHLPAWAVLTDAHSPDVKALDELPVLPGACYVMDRAYVDFQRLFELHQKGAFFVVRNRRDVQWRVMGSRSVNQRLGLRCDQTISLTSHWSIRSYPEPLRRIVFYDREKDLRLELLTNQFELPALAIAQLYRQRWQIELFFRWVKQHLRLRAFYGRSANAVRTQVWSAICAYLLVAIIRKRLKLQKSLNEILQIISISIFKNMPLEQLLATTPSTPNNANTPTPFQKLLPFNDS